MATENIIMAMVKTAGGNRQVCCNISNYTNTKNEILPNRTELYYFKKYLELWFWQECFLIQECHERLRILAIQSATVMKTEGVPCDLLDRIKEDKYFSAIVDQLESCVDPASFCGLSVRQVTSCFTFNNFNFSTISSNQQITEPLYFTQVERFVEEEIKPVLQKYKGNLTKSTQLEIWVQDSSTSFSLKHVRCSIKNKTFIVYSKWPNYNKVFKKYVHNNRFSQKQISNFNYSQQMFEFLTNSAKIAFLYVFIFFNPLIIIIQIIFIFSLVWWCTEVSCCQIIFICSDSG